MEIRMNKRKKKLLMERKLSNEKMKRVKIVKGKIEKQSKLKIEN